MKVKVLEELRFSVAIVFSREEVVPLPDDLRERERRMLLVSGFMAWKSATAFVLSTELREPDCAVSVGVARDGVVCVARPILRTPVTTVGAIEWLPESAVGEEVVALLPRGRVLLDAQTEAALVRAFGTGGEFAARRALS